MKNYEILDDWKLILKQKFKGYNVYQRNFSCLSFKCCEIFTFIHCTCDLLKRDRVALVWQPPTAPDPQDILDWRRALRVLAGLKPSKSKFFYAVIIL